MEHNEGSLDARVAAELRAELARQGRSRRWLSARVGAPPVTVARWVRGDTSPSLEALDAMARALGTTLPRFLAEVQRRGYDRAPLFEVTPDLLSEQTEARVRGRDEAGDVGGRIRSAVGERALSAYTAGKLAGARRRAGGEDGAEDVPVPRPPVAVFSTPA